MPTIIDQHGNPFERAVLTEPQTASLGYLAREFENHPSRGLTPPRLARILESAERGDILAQHELFMDMEEKDAHIYAEMSKRKRALLTLDWDIAPPRNASKAEEADAAFVRDALLDFPNLEDLMLDALDAIGHGFACLELEWELAGREWLPKAAHHRPQTWFKTAQEDRNELRLRDMSGDGATLKPFGWIVHRHAARSGYVARSGLHRVLAWPFLFKNYAVRDLAEFLEIYGLPLRLGKYPVGANDKEKATLLRAVTGIGHAAAGIIPEGMAIEFEEAAKGQSDPYLAMMDWAERSESKAIVGQTTSSEAKNTGLGSGVAALHGEVRRDLKVSDARQLGGTLTRDLVYPILALNRGVRDPRRLPRFFFDTGEAEDMKMMADALPKLVGVGMRVPVAWAHAKLRVPEPKDGEAVLQVARPALTVPPSERPADLAATRAALKADGDTADEFDRLADDMASEWERVAGPLVSPLTRLAEECRSLEEFRARLPAVIEQMDTAALAEQIAEGDFAAAIYGRLHNG